MKLPFVSSFNSTSHPKNHFRKARREELFNRTRLEIGNFVLEVRFGNRQLEAHAQHNFQEFVVDKEPDQMVEIFSHLEIGDEVDWKGLESKTHWYGTKVFKYPFHFQIEKSTGDISVILPKEFEMEGIDNFLRMVVSSRGIQKGQVLLHASAIVRENGAVLFVAPSGTGKSTIAGLSGEKVLHDDIVALSIGKEGKVELATIPFKPPFHKDRFSGPLQAIYRIYQSDSTEVKNLSLAEQLAQMIFSVWNLDDLPGPTGQAATNNQQLISLWQQLLPHCAVRELYFTKTNDFLGLI